MNPTELQAERNTLIAEIYAAFKGVSRLGGVSWSESAAIDGYGTEDERRQARQRDTDENWTELAINKKWDAGPGDSRWIFLDAIGFRYYLPAAMVRSLLSGYEAYSCYDLSFTLTLNKATKPSGIEQRESTLQKWSLLNDRQRKCVARYVRYMITWEESRSFPKTGCHDEATTWRQVYERHWKMFE